MDKYKVDKTVIITGMWHYLNDNRYTSYCVKSAPDRFAGIGLLVGKHMHAPDDPANPARLEKLIRDDFLCGIRLSPLCATLLHPMHRSPLLRADATVRHRADDPEVRWLDSHGCDPLWEKAVCRLLGETKPCTLRFGAGRQANSAPRPTTLPHAGTNPSPLRHRKSANEARLVPAPPSRTLAGPENDFRAVQIHGGLDPPP